MPKASPQRKLHTPQIDAKAVLGWYDRHARKLPWRVGPADRRNGVAPDPYRVWLAEVMLQQTTVVTVAGYFARFTALWPTLEALAAAPLQAVLVEWAGLGYYARARNLHACAQAVARDHGGRFPASAAGLRALPGIGAYTGAAIAAICFDERAAVLDGNVERVLARYLALDVPVRQAKDALRAALQPAVPPRAGDFAQALMDLGATICAPRAAMCLVCPLRPGCLGARTADPLAYPVKLPKAVRPTRYGHAFVIRDAAGDVYLRTRAETGLLAQMTETPVSAWTASAHAVAFPFASQWAHRGQVGHVFTHFRLELEVWSTVARGKQRNLSEGWWADPAELAGEALPSLFRKVLAQAGVGSAVPAK